MGDNNLHRDLVRKLKLGALNLFQPYEVRLMLWDARQRPPRKSPVDLNVLLPHEYLS